MHIVFQTRFSFFGLSGWKSAATTDPERLFAPERLNARFRYFETITLPSLAAQSNPDFTHMVLSSNQMPNPYRRLLREMVHDTLGASRVRVMFRPHGSAGGYFRSAMANTYGDDLSAQIVLDDDDAVSADFAEVALSHAEAAMTTPHREDNYLFLSYPRGYTLILENGRPAALRKRYVPYTNLGLTLVGPGNTRRNPFATSHRRIGQRHPSVLVSGTRPYYLRAVHDHNDSNAHRKDVAPSAAEIDALTEFFPFHTSLFGTDGQRRAA